MKGFKKGYIIRDKKCADTYLSFIRNDGVLHTEWVHTEWMDCCKMYMHASYAKKIAQMVGGEVLRVVYDVDDLGIVPCSVKVTEMVA